jgi:hypothetical protein
VAQAEAAGNWCVFGRFFAMFKRGKMRRILALFLVPVLVFFCFWLLVPRIGRRIGCGMSRAQVEALTGQTPMLSMLWSSDESEFYSCPDGDFIVTYSPILPFGPHGKEDIAVDVRPASVWGRICGFVRF